MDVVARSGWGATASLGPPMRLPAAELFVHHSVTPATADPAADMRLLERIGVQRFGRFSYSWAVHPSGVVLEGAGTTVGAHTGGRNSTSFGVVWPGNYEQDKPTVPQIRATAELIRWLVAAGKLVRGAPIGGHRDVASTACPGRYAYAALPSIRQLVSAPDLQEDIVASVDEMKAAMRAVLNEGTIRGQTSWAGSNKELGDRTGHIVNQLNALAAQVAGIDVDVDVDEAALAVELAAPLANELAPLISEHARTLSDDDLAAVAKAVADEQHRRSAE